MTDRSFLASRSRSANRLSGSMATMTEDQKTKAAAHAATWRARHPDRYRTTKARQAARRRAFVRLARLHQREFDALFAEELLSR